MFKSPCPRYLDEVIVLIVEANLMWSVRLANGVRALGHEAVVSDDFEKTADLAIINLGESRVGEVVQRLKAKGVPILAHAGHKEKELIDLGKSLGIERLATNSELTHKLDKLLAEFVSGT